MSNANEVIFDIIASLERRIKYLEKRDGDLDKLEEKIRILELKLRDQEASNESHSDTDPENEQIDQPQNNIAISEVFSNFKNDNFEDMDQQSTFPKEISHAKIKIEDESLENSDSDHIDDITNEDEDLPLQLPLKSRSGRIIKKKNWSDSDEPPNELFGCQICKKTFTNFSRLEAHIPTHNMNLMVNKTNKKVKLLEEDHHQPKPKASPPPRLVRNNKGNNDDHLKGANVCKICSKVYVGRKAIRRHLIKHSNKYLCPYQNCSRTFSQRFNLVSHQKNRHHYAQ